MLAGVTDSDYKGEMGLLLHENVSGIQEIQPGVSQYYQALRSVNGKLQQPNSGTMTNGPGPFRNEDLGPTKD